VMMIPDVLGNLRDLVSGKGTKPATSNTSAPAEVKRDQQVIPSEQVADWLKEIDDLTKAEDLDGVQAKIQMLRSQIGSKDPD
jgi:hypothetical protein